jgi:hypothetical protein
MATITSTSFPSTNLNTNFTELGVTHNGDGNLSISSFNGARSAPYYCRFDGSNLTSTFNINAQGGANWSFYIKGVSGNGNLTIRVNGSPVSVTWASTAYANGIIPFYSSQYYAVNFNIPSGNNTVTFQANGIWAMDDAVLTIQDPPYAESYTSTGGLSLTFNSTTKLTMQYTSISGLALSGDSVETFTGIYFTTVNYLITGPNQREITNSNKYFKLEITNDAIIDEELNITLISSDLNSTFSSISPITNENRYVEFFYFPSEVGRHHISAITNNENYILNGNEFEFLSTSSDPEEGIYPKIKFKVDFNIENLNLDINALNTKTIRIPDVNRELKQGDEFVLHGEAALYVKKNYINGVFNCLRIV